jgi:subtilisin family serine protease
MRICAGAAAVALLAMGALAGAGRAEPSVPGSRIMLGYEPGAAEKAATLERRLSLRRVATIPQLTVDVVEAERAALGATLAALRADTAIRYAELDGRVQALRVPNDPLWSTQWSPVRTRAVQAWDRAVGTPQTVVAVLDTGIDAKQPDLRGKLAPGFDFVNGDADPADDNGHGTAVAGIIGAAGDNGIGVAGYCWRCTLMPLKVLGADGSGFFSSVAQGIVWATDNGARVINASLGGPLEDATVAAAVQYARSHGTLLVAAAGNDSSSALGYPAALPGVLSVSASNPSDRLYAFSNTGAGLAAPGENSTTSRGARYERFLGTSSAAPVVSGIAALLVGLVPSATPDQVALALEQSAVPIPDVVFGRVDAAGALEALSPAPATVTAPAPTGASSTKTTTVFRDRIGRRGRSFWITAGAGILRAKLTAGRTDRPIRLALRRAGRVVAARSGRRLIRLRARTRPGRYRLVVTGPVGLVFRLTLSYPPGR